MTARRAQNDRMDSIFMLRMVSVHSFVYRNTNNNHENRALDTLGQADHGVKSIRGCLSRRTNVLTATAHPICV